MVSIFDAGDQVDVIYLALSSKRWLSMMIFPHNKENLVFIATDGNFFLVASCNYGPS